MTNQHNPVPDDDFFSLLTLWQSRTICSIATAFVLLLAFFSIAPDFFEQSHTVLLGWILVTALAWLRGWTMDTALNHELPKRRCQSVAALFDLLIIMALSTTVLRLEGNIFLALPLIGIYWLTVLLYSTRSCHPLNKDACKDMAISQWLTVCAIALLASMCARFAGFFLMLLPMAIVSWQAQQYPLPYRYSGAMTSLLLPLVVIFAGMDTFLTVFHYTICAFGVVLGVLISDKGTPAAHFSPRQHFWTMLLVPQVVALIFDSAHILAAWT